MTISFPGSPTDGQIYTPAPPAPSYTFFSSRGVWIPNGTPQATSARMQASWASGGVVANDTIYFVYDPPYAGTINSLTHFVLTGSFTIAVQIAGVSVTGLSAVAPTSTPTTTNATALNTFSAGQHISGVITGASGAPTDALLSLNLTWIPPMIAWTTGAAIGALDFSGLPTSDPGGGKLWLNGGVLQVGPI